MIASLVLGLAIFSVMAQGNEVSTTAENNGIKANAEEKMKKILSPDQIKFFKNIEKRGMSLFGIKKDKIAEKDSGGDKKLKKNLSS